MARELGRPTSVDDVRPIAATAAAEVFGLRFEELSADEIADLVRQPVAGHATSP
jgi:hypothetical protein